MPKRTAVTIGGVVATTLLIAGIAWASGADDSPTSTTPSTATSIDDNDTTITTDDSTPTSLNGQTSTTVDDNTSTSSANSSTSTSIDDNTSSTVDDDDSNDDKGRGGDDGDDSIDDDNSGKGGGGGDDSIDDDNSGKGGGDDDNAVAIADGTRTYDVAGVGTVTVNVVSGQMQLTDVQANSGWTVEIDRAQENRVKVKFRNGESEAEFEAELEQSGIKIDVEVGR